VKAGGTYIPLGFEGLNEQHISDSNVLLYILFDNEGLWVMRNVGTTIQ
jgi:hypothetical protein